MQPWLRLASVPLVLAAVLAGSVPAARAEGGPGTRASRLALALRTPAWTSDGDRTDSSHAGRRAPARSGFWLAAGAEGPVWRADRVQHASLGATLTLAFAAAGLARGEAAAAALGLGLVKEGIDAARGTGASRLDLAADLAGVALGLVAAGALE